MDSDAALGQLGFERLDLLTRLFRLLQLRFRKHQGAALLLQRLLGGIKFRHFGLEFRLFRLQQGQFAAHLFSLGAQFLILRLQFGLLGLQGSQFFSLLASGRDCGFLFRQRFAKFLNLRLEGGQFLQSGFSRSQGGSLLVVGGFQWLQRLQFGHDRCQLAGQSDLLVAQGGNLGLQIAELGLGAANGRLTIIELVLQRVFTLQCSGQFLFEIRK